MSICRLPSAWIQSSIKQTRYDIKPLQAYVFFSFFSSKFFIYLFTFGRSQTSCSFQLFALSQANLLRLPAHARQTRELLFSPWASARKQTRLLKSQTIRGFFYNHTRRNDGSTLSAPTSHNFKFALLKKGTKPWSFHNFDGKITLRYSLRGQTSEMYCGGSYSLTVHTFVHKKQRQLFTYHNVLVTLFTVPPAVHSGPLLSFFFSK